MSENKRLMATNAHSERRHNPARMHDFHLLHSAAVLTAAFVVAT